jgi:hypothetical protein
MRRLSTTGYRVVAAETRSTITMGHQFCTEIPLKAVKELSPMAAANVAKLSSKYLI